MSDQQETGGITSLEEVFLAREFGRQPSRGISTVGGDEGDEETPAQLEQVFLAPEFGHPQPVTVPVPVVSVSARPALVALPGGAPDERDSTRYRAIAAVSGVAAAALVVAGLASGTGQPAKQPTQSASGPRPGQGSPGQTNVPPGTGLPVRPGASGTGAGRGSGSGAGGSGGATLAQLTSATTPSTPEVIVEVPPGTPVEIVPSPGGTPPGGTAPGSPPGGTSPSGGLLQPVLVVVGGTVSSLGTTVTVTSNDLGNALPVASPVTGLLGNVGSTVTGLGQAVADA